MNWLGNQSAPSRIDERIQDLLDDARAARQLGDWKLTQSLVNAVLALDPMNTEASGLVAGSAPRRQMTLMFCDIVGSTEIADSRDPEEVSSLLRAYRATCTEVVDRFGGYIDDHRGDGMLVLFGYPQVHEDDARRAVQCGRAIISTLPRRLRALSGSGGDVPLQVRIAVHTDLVVLDGVGVAGATANETARIQDFAEPNTVVLSDATRALVWPYFETVSIGEVELRGVSRPVEIFTVLRDRNTGDRPLPISPFVGRERELAELGAFLHGQSSALVVSGPPGVGKTRLISEASSRYNMPFAECRCSRFQQNTSLHAFRKIIETVCEIVESNGPGERLRRLRARAGPEAMTSDGDLPFLAVALDIPLTMLSTQVDVDPNLLRERALRVAVELVASVAAHGPRMLFIDDVHWADQSSVDLITLLVAKAPAGLRVVLTSREGFEPPWPVELVERLRLEPLSHASMKDLAELVPEGSGLSAEDREELIERSDGIPLFLEELLRTADAVGSGRVLHRSIRFGDYQIPPALRDPLLARLSSPQVDLELAQVAATIGRDVDRHLLQRVVGGDDAEFQNRLDTLFVAGLVESSERGVRFRHELIREVAYETQKRSTLRLNHSAIADQLSEGPQMMTPRMSGETASHLERAHRYVEAIAAHVEAAAADQAVGAHVEATRRLTHTLDLVDKLEQGPDRQHTELLIRGMRSFSAVMTGGYAAPEAAVDYSRSAQLCELLAGAPEIVPSLINSWSYYAMRGDLEQADAVTVALVRECALADNDFPALSTGTGMVDFFRGEFGGSRRMLEAFANSGWGATSERPPPSWPLPNDPLVAVGAHLAMIRWVEGDPRAAEIWVDTARDRSNQLSFPFGPFSVCYVDHFAALVRNLEGDYVAVAELGSDMLRLGERHGFAMWQLTAALHLGVSAVHLGQHSAVDQLAEQVSMARVVLASDVYTPYWLTQLALAQHVAGRAADALLSLEQALQVAERTGSAFFSAETLRTVGKLRVEAGNPAGIRDVQAAVDLARRQGAPAFEQRARSTLAELKAT